MEKDFSALSLEYKLANINQVKSFSRYLNDIHCFYTDRQVDFDMLEEFTPEQIQRIAPRECIRSEKKKPQNCLKSISEVSSSERWGDRTPDNLIKSQVLYRLS